VIRLAVRALILRDDRLLVVNAYPTGGRELWCCPGGGVERHVSLPDNLAREVHEETGLAIRVGPLRLINEFHDPAGDYHQVDLMFRVTAEGDLSDAWRDPEGVVHSRRLVTRGELAALPHRPLRLAEAAWQDGPVIYDPLEPILR
jgi:ADP-ribose pyrophosphatase YjhB (NUDIX family)